MIEPLGALSLFSIGHSNHTIEGFTALLDAHAIRVVVDVRSKPYSRHHPQFKSGPLERNLALRGLRYVYLGQELGGRPEDPAMYDESGELSYAILSATNGFRAGIARLIMHARLDRTAILCAEENPLHCHRHHILGRALAERGVGLQHIRRDQSLEPQAPATPAPPRQRELFPSVARR